MLDEIFTKLPDLSQLPDDPDIAYYKTITVYDNEGASTCNSMLAVNKGWIVTKTSSLGLEKVETAPLLVVQDGATLQVMGIEAGSRYQIIDMSGRVVLSGIASTATLSIDASMLAHGHYVLRATTGAIKIAL